MLQHRLNSRGVRVLLFTRLMLITVALLVLVATLITRLGESELYNQTVVGFQTNPAVVTALVATQTAKAWTVTPSPTILSHIATPR